MSAPRPLIALLAALCLLPACAGDDTASGPIASTNRDTATSDSGTVDAGTLHDAAVPADSTAPVDSGGADQTGSGDTGPGADLPPIGDTGSSDAGAADGDDAAPSECTTAQDCAAPAEACRVATCKAGACGFADEPDGQACDDGDSCTGEDLCKGGTCLPGAATTCDDGNSCTLDSCDPTKGCGHADVSVTCDDGDKCTLADQCKGGACAAGGALDCDDDNPCTDDGCEALIGCVHTANTAACSDDNACTVGDACNAKVCLPGEVTSCNDGNPCTTDSCDPGGGCATSFNKQPCDDGDKCTVKDVCGAGACVSGDKLVCDDNDVCTDDGCDPESGCTAAKNTAPCDDGDLCTKDDACKDGRCTAGAGTTCDDGNPCTTDGCDKDTGCSFKLNSGACDDGNKCTDFDLCQKGKCRGVAKDPGQDCDDGNGCTTDACDPARGCTQTANTASCDDGNPCSKGDQCKQGKCAPGSNVCECTEDSHCAPNNPDNPCLGTLYCDKSAAPFTCRLNPATVVKCSAAGDTACSKNLCDPKTLKCTRKAVAEGRPCDADGSVCTVGDKCATGTCLPGKALACDDHKVCTNDACDPAKGCVNTANAAPCDADGNPCTVGDVCQGGSCHAGKKKDCDDDDPCTADSCALATGACKNDKIAGCGGNCRTDAHCDDSTTCTTQKCDKKPGQRWGRCLWTNQPGKCTDFNGCTENDHCDAGKCVGTAKKCEDGNPCTNDGCDPTSGCVFPHNSAPCNDYDKCTLGDTCKAGKCAAGVPKKCDDGDKCTLDTCNPATGGCSVKGIPGCGGYCDVVGDCDDKNACTSEVCDKGRCVSKAVAGACTDGNACTLKDRCTAGKCAPGAKKSCDDGNGCTTDSCDVKTGVCGHLPVKQGVACDDGDHCSSGDKCGLDGGKLVCVGKKKNCNDGNACTDDLCDALSGNCQPKANTKPCDDGNKCTVGDACSDAKCVAGTGVNVDTLAGSGPSHGNKGGFADGPGDKALFSYVYGVAVNRAQVVYAADPQNHRIRKILQDGTTSTLAGSGKVGLLDGKGAGAWFNAPFGVDVGPGGAVYVADTGNHAVRVVRPDGTTTTLAGNGNAGHTDGGALQARFRNPYSLEVTAGGVVVVADTYNHRIRKVAAGIVSTLAGTGARGSKDGPGSQATFDYPADVAVDAAGNILVTNMYRHNIRRIDAKGVVTTFSGTGVRGNLDGGIAKATWDYPWGIDVDSAGVIWVANRYRHRIRRIEGGVVTTRAGSGAAGLRDGKAAGARFYFPAGLAVDSGGTVYVADGHNHRIRRVRDSTAPCAIGGSCYAAGTFNPTNSCQRCDAAKSSIQWTADADGKACTDGDLCTSGDVCGSGACKGKAKSCDDGDKCTLDACDKSTGQCVFNPIIGCGGNCTKATDCDDKNPCTTDACVTAKCDNAPNSLPCDDGNPCTAGDRCWSGACAAGAGTVVSTLAGNGKATHADGAATKASFRYPRGVGLDGAGHLYVADGHNHRIRRVAIKDGTTTTVAGTGIAGFADGSAASALFNMPSDVAPAPGKLVYVADIGNQRVRTVDVAKGQVSTLAGGTRGFADGKGTAARFNVPYGLVASAKGVVFVADYANHRIRKVLPDGTVSTLAGAARGFTNGTGTAARFNGPIALALDRHGVLFVSDYSNHAIRRVGMDGKVTTVAGDGKAGNIDGAASGARFYHPWGIGADGAGRIYVVDRNNHVLKRIAGGVVTRIAGVNSGFRDGDGLTVARFSYPLGLALGPDGSAYVGDYGNQRIRKVFVSRLACRIGGACWAEGTPDPANPCRSCAGGTDAKGWTGLADGAACTDGDPCTAPDLCAAGKCSSKAVACDDSDKCTKDLCDSTGVCRNEPIIGCGGYCTKDADCKDGNGCTDDLCKQSKCIHPANVLPCDDGNPCSLGDRCSGGACRAGHEVWVDTVAGTGSSDNRDGDALKEASFSNPIGLAIGGGGAIFFGDRGHHVIKRLAGGTVTTLAGSGASGFGDGPAMAAQFYDPADVDLAAGGALYIADRGNHRIRLLAAGTVHTLAGATVGYADGKGTAARFNNPYGVAVAGSIAYVADYSNHRIRRVDADGKVTTLAGSSAGYANGKGTAARFYGPVGVDVGPDGMVYVVEYAGHRVRRITPDGTVTLVAGSTTNTPGYIDADGANARFRYPWGIAVAPNGRLYVGDGHNHRIREITGTLVSTFAGSGTSAFANGAGPKAHFHYPRGMAVDDAGVLYVGDQYNHRIRRLRDGRKPCRIGGSCYPAGTPSSAKPCLVCDAAKSAGAWSPLADGEPCEDGKSCTSGDACAKGACVGKPIDCNDADACTKDSCIAGTGACTHQRIIGCGGYCTEDKHCDDGNPCTVGDVCVNHQCGKGTRVLTTTVAGIGGGGGFIDGPIDKARMNAPYDVAVAADGRAYIADYNNNRVRLLAAGKLTTLAGSGKAGLKSGQGTAAWFNRPAGVALTADGSVFVADRYSHTIRKIDKAARVTTFAGNGGSGAANGKGTHATFREPIGIAAGLKGTLYLADYANHRIRRIAADGTVSTFAGSSYGYKDGQGTAAQFRGPIGVATDGHGQVYVSEYSGHRIRRITADGLVSTVAGSGQAGLLDGDAATAEFYSPWGIAVDSAGRIFVASHRYHRIRMIEAGVVETIAGSSAGWADGAKARFYYPLGIGLDRYGRVWVADYYNQRIRVVRRTAASCSIDGACWADGIRNPSVACRACQGAKAPKAWSDLPDTAACEDGSLCTVGDVCQAGKCGGAARDCDDKDPATKDSCDVATGGCVNQ